MSEESQEMLPLDGVDKNVSEKTSEENTPKVKKKTARKGRPAKKKIAKEPDSEKRST